MSIYTDLLAIGAEVDNHYADLYVKATKQALEVLVKHGCRFESFRSVVDGAQWFDVPFAFDPYWEGKLTAAGDIH